MNQPNENQEQIPVGASFPLAGEIPEGTQPGTPDASSPVSEAESKDIKGFIDCVRPVKNGRKFVFQDHSEAFLWNDGVIWTDPVDTPEHRQKLLDAIERWKKLRGFQPTKSTI